MAPGGALRSVELEPEALRLGPAALAATITALVREATRNANRAAEEAMRDRLGGLTDADLAALGLAQDDPLIEDDEEPGTEGWRQ
ncbi:hypothetical protein GCM10023222_22690 [Saccharopolyspora cebuensis]